MKGSDVHTEHQQKPVCLAQAVKIIFLHIIILNFSVDLQLLVSYKCVRQFIAYMHMIIIQTLGIYLQYCHPL